MDIAHWAKGVQSSWEKTLCPVLLQGGLLATGERNNPLGSSSVLSCHSQIGQKLLIRNLLRPLINTAAFC